MLRPNTVELRADSLITFAEYLATHHSKVRSLAQLSRQHMEDFRSYNHGRPWRGRVARDQPVSPTVSKRTVIDLRCFLDDLTIWGWAERPPGRLLFASDIPASTNRCRAHWLLFREADDVRSPLCSLESALGWASGAPRTRLQRGPHGVPRYRPPRAGLPPRRPSARQPPRRRPRRRGRPPRR